MKRQADGGGFDPTTRSAGFAALNLMPISHDILNLKGNSTFSRCSEWNKFLKRFSGSTKDGATEDRSLNQFNFLVNISFFKIEKLGRKVCETLFQNIYGLLFAILHHK